MSLDAAGLDCQTSNNRASPKPPPRADAARARRGLCICIDDVGLNAGIADAAIELVSLGRVHALGCMVGGKAWASAAVRLRELKSNEIDVGLHLDLTEFPVGQAPQRLSSLIAASYLGRLDHALVRAEIRAQLDSFEQTLGRAPAFVDGHQHVHQLPIVRDELLDELVRRHSHHRPWLRSTNAARDLPRVPGEALMFWLKPRIIENLGAVALARGARRAGFRQNQRLLGVYDFSGGQKRYLALLRSWLEVATERDLLMCHPSRASNPEDTLCDSRQAEYEVLASAQFAESVAARGIVLSPISRMIAASDSGES